MNEDLLSGIDHVELYVFKTFQAANFYRAAFGFDIIIYAGSETGIKDQISYFLIQGSIPLVITSVHNRDFCSLDFIDSGVKRLTRAIYSEDK